MGSHSRVSRHRRRHGGFGLSQNQACVLVRCVRRGRVRANLHQNVQAMNMKKPHTLVSTSHSTTHGSSAIKTAFDLAHYALHGPKRPTRSGPRKYLAFSEEKRLGCWTPANHRLSLTMAISSVNNGIPQKSQHRPQNDGCWRRNPKPPASNITRRHDHNPPGVVPQAPPKLESLVEVSDLPDPVHSRIDQAHRASVDSPE